MRFHFHFVHFVRFMVLIGWDYTEPSIETDLMLSSAVTIKTNNCSKRYEVSSSCIVDFDDLSSLALSHQPAPCLSSLAPPIIRPCRQLQINVSTEFLSFNLISLLGLYDSDESIYSMTIYLPCMHESHEKYIALSVEIDAFLTTRPWWILRKEPLLWEDSSVILFERYHSNWNAFFKYLTHTQYPDIQDCEKISLLVSHTDCVSPGWGDVMSTIGNVRVAFPYSIYTSYYPRVPYRKFANAFFNDSDTVSCAKKNKWDCAFLTASNCTLPRNLSKCNTPACLARKTRYIQIASLYDKATSDGNFIKGHTFSKEKVYSFGSIPVTSAQRVNQVPYERRYRYKLAYDRSIYVRQPVRNVSDDAIDFVFNLLLRPSAFYRNRIGRLIRKFYEVSTPLFTATDSCVTAHVRRGDRILNIPGVSMTEWCANATREFNRSEHKHFNPNMCMNEDGFLDHCSYFPRVDFGCMKVPFGAVTIGHIIQRAEQLVGPLTRNLIVFTDDARWIREQLREISITHPHWNVYYLPEPKVTIPLNVKSRKFLGINGEFNKKYAYTRSMGMTESGVYFHASLHLAQQCSAMVGHFSSYATRMFYHKMCTMHDRFIGVCPPMYDFSYGL